MSSTVGPLLEVAWDEVASRVRGARKDVVVVTPFLSRAVARQLAAEATLAKAKQLRLLTWLNGAATGSGYLDPAAIEELLRSGWQVRSLERLHAKVVLVDGRWGLVGSGNFTGAGMQGGNVELGVVVTDARQRLATQTVERWWKHGLEVTQRRLKSFAKDAPRFASAPRNSYGGRYRVPVSPRVRSQAQRAEPGMWLKMMYATGARERRDYWLDLPWVSDSHYFGKDGEPKRRPTYQPGDKLVCYVTEPWWCCPAILEVLDSPRFDEDLVRSEGEPDDYKRWSWVTPVRALGAVDRQRAPTLGQIGVASSSVRQQSHIHLNRRQYQRAASWIL